ncbi:MAG: HAD family hydrolase [Eubacteriales bacterium]|nr:HAD family hydrolase [Eubacteriales bacterium]
MTRKLIFLDIDGTILIPGEQIRQTVVDGLKKARANGHMVFICTGRAHSSLPDELDRIELDGQICSAGSDIWIGGENRWSCSLDPKLIEKACRILEEMDAVCLLEGFKETFMSRKGTEILTEEVRPGDNSELARWKSYFRRRPNVRSLSEWDPKQSPIPKVTFIVWRREQMDEVRRKLGEDFYVAFFQSSTKGVYNGELISRTENKGTAIRRTAQLLGEDVRNTVAFGDSMNDYQMIEEAACGVVMENGDEALKAIADRVCESVREDGVIRELARMGVV